MVKYVCPSCNRSGRVVYANGASAAVCSLCGTIVPSDLLSKLTQDTSGALSNVDGFVAEGASFGLDGDEDREAEYELDGLRGRRDDQAEGGRTYLGSGGNIFSENGGTRMQGTNVRKLEGRVEYQRREKVRFLHQLLGLIRILTRLDSCRPSCVVTCDPCATTLDRRSLRIEQCFSSWTQRTRVT